MKTSISRYYRQLLVVHSNLPQNTAENTKRQNFKAIKMMTKFKERCQHKTFCGGVTICISLL